MAEGQSGEGQGSAAGSQGSGSQGQQGQGSGTQGEGQTVPISVVQSIRDDLNELKEKNQALEDQVALYRANLTQGNQSGVRQGQDSFDGMEDDDVVTAGDMKKIIGSLGTQISHGLRDLQLGQTHSDYADVVKTHLPNVLKANPELAEAIRTSKNPQVLAYSLAKTDPAYQKKISEQQMQGGEGGDQGEGQGQSQNQGQQAAAQATANAQRPGSASGAGGAGAGISAAAQYEQMSDDELEARIEEVKARE